jgi:hypothetical protein
MSVLKLSRKLAILAVLTSAALASTRSTNPISPPAPGLYCDQSCSCGVDDLGCAYSVVNGKLVYHGCC